MAIQPSAGMPSSRATSVKEAPLWRSGGRPAAAYGRRMSRTHQIGHVGSLIAAPARYSVAALIVAPATTFGCPAIATTTVTGSASCGLNIHAPSQTPARTSFLRASAAAAPEAHSRLRAVVWPPITARTLGQKV